MITAPVGVELRPLTIPASIDSPDAADFIEMVRVRNRVYREISGHDDHRIAADELLPHYQPDEYQRRLVWIVAVDGDDRRPRRGRPSAGGRLQARVLAHRTAARRLGSRHRLRRVRPRRADRPRERPHGPAVVGRAPRRAGPASAPRRPASATIPEDHAARFYRAARLHARAGRAQQRVRPARPVRRGRAAARRGDRRIRAATGSCSGSRRRRPSSSTAMRG